MRKLLFGILSVFILQFPKAQQSLTETIGSAPNMTPIDNHNFDQEIRGFTYSGTGRIYNDSPTLSGDPDDSHVRLLFQGDQNFEINFPNNEMCATVDINISFSVRRNNINAGNLVVHTNNGTGFSINSTFTNSSFTNNVWETRTVSFTGNSSSPFGVRFTHEGGTNGQYRIDNIVFSHSDANCQLPITLTTFTGKRVGSVIHLAWETASEEQNDYLEVQRSRDGKRFETIGGRIESKAGAAGTSQVPLQYAFTDDSPLPGINYYRLQQFDLDGRYEYHKTIAVLFDKHDGKQPDITVFPSVTSDRVNVALPQEAAADGELYIINLAGQVVLRTPFERGMQQENIDVARLPQGHYVITVQTGRAVFTARFVKQ